MVKNENIASEHTYKFSKTEEGFNQKTENAQYECCSSGNAQNKLINDLQNLSDVVTDVQNLVKIFLEVRK